MHGTPKHPHGLRPALFDFPSLTLMSAGQRLAGVAVLLALLWAAVVWVLGIGA